MLLSHRCIACTSPSLACSSSLLECTHILGNSKASASVISTQPHQNAKAWEVQRLMLGQMCQKEHCHGGPLREACIVPAWIRQDWVITGRDSCRDILSTKDTTVENVVFGIDSARTCPIVHLTAHPKCRQIAGHPKPLANTPVRIQPHYIERLLTV